MGSRKRIGEYFGTAAIACFVLVGVLYLAVLSAGSYKAVLAAKQADIGRRGTFSYLATRVAAGDRAGQVQLRDSGAVLVITEQADDAVYETRIYAAAGQLLEDYAAAGTALGTGTQPIAEAAWFEASYAGEGLLYLATDAGGIYVKLMSGEGSEHG